ncbi:MAG: ATP-binding protein [Prevotellaceae bacterium]|nr:ATP-binding protein [Prevotella sp.]MDD7421103.1 ATP-binding protein [Prevotellaceae bacterium]
MFKRLALNYLRKWAQKEERKPLVLRGARQVGKTTLVKMFADDFDHYIYLNLEEADNAKLFAADSTFDDLLAGIFFRANLTADSHRTLIFIDEIQNEPKAVQALRYFYERRPDLYVIAAGSLLESLMGRHISFPVGRVEYMALHPCTFTEFLSAIGEEALACQIEKIAVPQSLHSYTLELFKKYMIIGGLPEVVANYAQHRDMVRLNGVFNSLLSGYRDDVEKYADKPREQDTIRYILNYGWTSAAHRIQFAKFTNTSFKSADVSNAFRTLEKALLLELVYPLTSTSFPILPDLKKSPKLFWLDTGLVNYVAGMQEELLFTTDSDELWNGDIAEHSVAQELLGATTTFGEKRMFWVRDARNSQAEVDFVLRHKSHLLPIEVKTGSNSKLRSLHLFMEESKENIALRLWNGPMTSDVITRSDGRPFTLYNIPLYYAGHLYEWIRQARNATI